MRKHSRSPQLPRGWTVIVRKAVLQAIALGRFVRAERRYADARKDGEIALLREELRIKDLRAARIHPARRPHYSPTERMAILELKAARGWSAAETARVFLVTEPTIVSWLNRLDEPGPQALVRTAEPVNKYPLFVHYLVRRLKTLHPELGKRKLAAVLARAGLHLGTTTVARILKSPVSKGPKPLTKEASPPRAVTARQPHDVWHVDLTVVPIGGGFWVPWLPFALPQRHPFAWWVAAIVDGYSRKVLGWGCFKNQPTGRDVRKLFARTIGYVGAKPQTIVCDRGKQFDCDRFRSWCRHRRRKIRVRYGAVGKHGSIAVVERFIRTLKEYLSTLPVVPLERRMMSQELRCFGEWLNDASYCHTSLFVGKAKSLLFAYRYRGEGRAVTRPMQQPSRPIRIECLGRENPRAVRQRMFAGDLAVLCG